MSAQALKIKPVPDCKACHGSGEVNDWVPAPFAPGNVPMPSLCDCIEEQVPEDYDGPIELDLSDYHPGWDKEPEL